MFLRSLRRLAAACVTLFGVVMVAIQVVVLVDLRTFEYVPLAQMVGGRGLALAIALNLGIALLVLSPVALLRGKRRPFPWTTGAAIAVFAILILWLLEWVLSFRGLMEPVIRGVMEPRQKAVFRVSNRCFLPSF